MAREIWAFDCLVAAGTPKASPATVDMSIPARRISRVQILVPPGPRGEVGFALGSSGFSVIPQSRGAFIVTDSELIDWPLEGGIESGAWTFFGYNTGTFNHTIRVRLLADLIEAGKGLGTLGLISSDALNPALDPALVAALAIPGIPPPPELPALGSIFSPFL